MSIPGRGKNLGGDTFDAFTGEATKERPTGKIAVAEKLPFKDRKTLFHSTDSILSESDSGFNPSRLAGACGERSAFTLA